MASASVLLPRSEVVVVTGCSTGLGRALCLELAKRPGTRVVATARKLSAIADLKDSGVALTLELDVGSEASIEAAIKSASELGGGVIDGVVCNAGGSCFGPLALQPMDEVKKVMDTNAFGVLRTIQAALPFMARPQARGGRILIVGSVSGSLTTPFAGAYCASKAAVQAYAEALRMELGPLGISVTTIHLSKMKSAFSSNAEADSSLDLYSQGVYAPILESIKMRIWTSQTHDAHSAEQVAADVVRKVFGSRTVAAVSVGGGVLKLLFLAFKQKFLPAWIMDGKLCKLFGIEGLKVDGSSSRR